MAAKYLVRFDDICPTMSWRVWARVEKIVRDCGIRPIVAVVPDNRDGKLDIDAPNANFWEQVREWDRMGWCVAIHGFQHVYSTQDSGILNLNPFSEFAGLPYEEQLRKITAAKAVFAAQGIYPHTWVAPGHSFDHVTLRVLRESGVTTVSDGYALWPHTDREGMFWIPQQLWRFRQFPLGVWTVCLHINNWSDDDVAGFAQAAHTFQDQLTSVDELSETYATRSSDLRDNAFAAAFRWMLVARRQLDRIG